RQSDRPDREALPSPLIGRAAPQFTLPLLHEPERQITSSDLLGQPYLLNVWGSWCPACREEHPVLSRYAATGQVRIVGYNWKDGPPAIGASTARRKPFSSTPPASSAGSMSAR